VETVDAFFLPNSASSSGNVNFRQMGSQLVHFPVFDARESLVMLQEWDAAILTYHTLQYTAEHTVQ
jgi:hypothetical protein